MIKDALQYLAELATRKQSVQTLKIPGGKTLLVFGDGTAREIDNDPINRDSEVSDTRSFVDLCSALEVGEIFVESDKAIGYSERELAHEIRTVKLALKSSKARKTLDEIFNQGNNLQQFVRNLRGPLFNCCPVDVLNVFRSMDFSRKNDGTRTISHKGESMGRAIEAQAQSRNGDIPEQIIFDIPFWSLTNSPIVRVVTAVEVDPNLERIVLIPVGDTLQAAHSKAISDLVALLHDAFDVSPLILRA